MKTNHWIAFSQRFYRWLLQLYPQAYRTAYESEMFHVFTDQCRDAFQQKGRTGVLLLWLRTFVDVGITVIREHLADPRARAGLLEAMPDAPLPWKGVLLVLIPGLIFFISQVEELISSKDWFFIVYYRAAYFLILPVLLVWLITRRFPVWGLIPFGLLYGILQSNNPSIRYLIMKLPLPQSSSSAISFNGMLDLVYLIPVSICLVSLCGLIWYSARQGQIHRGAWKWLGIYILLIGLEIALGAYRQALFQREYPDLQPVPLVEMMVWALYDSLPFLLLVFIGTLFAHKYGGYSYLLLLGYLLPTVIFGRYGMWNDAVPFYVVSLMILVYRFVVALVAPVWLVRAASIPWRQRAAAIPVALAIASQISLNIIVMVAQMTQSGYQPSLLDFTLTRWAPAIWSQLIIASGLGLAVALYLPKEPAVSSPPALAATSE